MKQLIVGAFFSLSLCASVYAQEGETFSDEELTKYATVMVWAKEEQGAMTEDLTGRIKGDDILAASRYNDLKESYGDDAKLKEVAATPEEIAAYEEILAYEDSIKSSFKDTYVGKIKSDISVGLYNDLKKALKSDADLKARYKDIETSLQEKDEETEQNEG